MKLLISKDKSISCKSLIWCTAEELRKLRDSEGVKNVLKAVRNGDKSKKSSNYYYCPNGTAKDKEAKVVTRNSDNMVSNNRVLVDIDIKDRNVWMPVYEAKVKGKEKALGIELVEESVSGGLHMVVRIHKHFTAKETLLHWKAYLRLNVDECTHDVARPCFLVPTEYVMYEAETFGDGESETIDISSMEEFRNIDNAETFSGTAKSSRTSYTQPITSFCSTHTPIIMDDCYRRTYMSDADEMVHLIEKVIEPNQIDITGDEPTWFAIACAIHSTLGAYGEDYFHRVSRFYPDYNRREAQKKWDYVASKGYSKVGFGTFVYHLMNNLTESQKAEAFSNNLKY